MYCAIIIRKVFFRSEKGNSDALIKNWEYFLTCSMNLLSSELKE